MTSNRKLGYRGHDVPIPPTHAVPPTRDYQTIRTFIADQLQKEARQARRRRKRPAFTQITLDRLACPLSPGRRRRTIARFLEGGRPPRLSEATPLIHFFELSLNDTLEWVEIIAGARHDYNEWRAFRDQARVDDMMLTSARRARQISHHTFKVEMARLRKAYIEFAMHGGKRPHVRIDH